MSTQARHWARLSRKQGGFQVLFLGGLGLRGGVWWSVVVPAQTATCPCGCFLDVDTHSHTGPFLRPPYNDSPMLTHTHTYICILQRSKQNKTGPARHFAVGDPRDRRVAHVLWPLRGAKSNGELGDGND